jgi:hypothetical protein
MARSVLEILPGDVQGALLASPYFADVPVFVLREKTVQSAIDQALAGATFKSARTGAAVIVLLPEIDVNNPNTPGPQLNVIQRVRVQEIPMFNMGSTGTKKSAEAIMEQVMAVLQFMSGQECYSDLFPLKEFVTPRPDLGPVTYDLAWGVTVLRAELGRAAVPEISWLGGVLTMASATPGMQIWFTTDETYPRPSVGGVAANGTLYTGPILNVESIGVLPFTVRAVAFDVAGGALAPSDVAWMRIEAGLLEEESGGTLLDEETGKVLTVEAE